MAATKKAKRGRGWHGNSRGHARAGQLGGRATAAKLGESFFSQIGRRGGLASKKRRSAQKQAD